MKHYPIKHPFSMKIFRWNFIQMHSTNIWFDLSQEKSTRISILQNRNRILRCKSKAHRKLERILETPFYSKPFWRIYEDANPADNEFQTDYKRMTHKLILSRQTNACTHRRKCCENKNTLTELCWAKYLSKICSRNLPFYSVWSDCTLYSCSNSNITAVLLKY